MPETYLRDTDCAARYGISRNTWWRWQRERTGLPRPVRLSRGCTRWKLSELVAWEQVRAETAA